jgi:hypothetical protein
MPGIIISLAPAPPPLPQPLLGQPAFAIGTVITLPAGSMATASLRGIYGTQFLDLGLPAGPAAATFWPALIAALPTTNPHVAGQPWLNGEAVCVSQG